MCTRRVHVPTELPFCTPPLLVGLSFSLLSLFSPSFFPSWLVRKEASFRFSSYEMIHSILFLLFCFHKLFACAETVKLFTFLEQCLSYVKVARAKIFLSPPPQKKTSLPPTKRCFFLAKDLRKCCLRFHNRHVYYHHYLFFVLLVLLFFFRVFLLCGLTRQKYFDGNKIWERKSEMAGGGGGGGKNRRRNCSNRGRIIIAPAKLRRQTEGAISTENTKKIESIFFVKL